MRLITLILTFLIAFYAYFHFFPLERNKEIAPPKKAEPAPQPPPNQSATHLKRRDYSALKDSVQTLSDEEKIALRKKIYLSLLNAIHKNNPQDIENLKLALEKLPQDAEQERKVTQALALRNVKALYERKNLIYADKNSPELKQAFDELLVVFALLDDEELTHTKDLLEQGEGLFGKQEINNRKTLLSYLSKQFNHYPAKAIALLELYPEGREEVLSYLIDTDNKADLNHYLSYASKAGIPAAAPAFDTASLFYEAQLDLLSQNFSEALLSLELLSRIDPALTDPSVAYASALYDQEYYEAFINEIKSVYDPNINEKRALAYIWTGNRAAGLEELKKIDVLNEDRSHRELAVDYLAQKDFQAAISQLQKLKNSYYYDDAARALAKFKQGDYKEALALIQKLPEPFRQNKAVRTLEVYSWLELKDEKEALNAALKSPVADRENSLYDPFLDALEKELSLPLAVGHLHLKSNNNELALEELQKAPSSFKTELEKAKLYLDSGKIDEAYAAINNAYKLKTGTLDKTDEALLERLAGLIYYERKQFIDAYAHFKKYAEIEDGKTDLIPRIESAFKIERYDVANKLLDGLDDGALKTFYKFKLNHYLSEKEPITISTDVLDSLNDNQKKEIALIYFDKGLYTQGKKIANDLKSKSAKLEIFTTTGDFKLAAPLALELKEDSSLEAYLALAIYYDRTSQNNEALAALNKALNLSPYNLELQTAVYSYPRALGDIEKQSSELKIETDKPDSSLSSKVLLGRIYLTEGITRQSENKDSYYFFPWEKAQLLFANLLKVMPDAPSIYLNQAQTLILLNKPNDSLTPLNKGIELAITSPELYRFKAISLAESDNTLEAITTIEMALKKNPYDPSLWSTLAFIQQDANHLLEARNAWQSYLKLKPRDSEGYFALADLAEKLNNPESAIQSISKIIALDPGNEKAKTKLKNLLADPLLRLSPKEKNKLDELIK